MNKNSRIVHLLLPLFALGLSVACNQTDLGRYCFVGTETGNANGNGSGTTTALNTEAPECGERLCVKQQGWRCLDGTSTCPEANRQIYPQATCTKECTKHDDCNQGNENVNSCGKFVCQKQGTETGFGDHCICVCLDFLRDVDGNSVDLEEFNQKTEWFCTN
jgi:hypothetical protein